MRLRDVLRGPLAMMLLELLLELELTRFINSGNLGAKDSTHE